MIRRLMLLSVVVLSIFVTIGCQHKVVALPNTDVVGLNAHDIVQVMVRAGFSDKQILTMGTDLRNRLAETGAAQIHIGDKIEAIFAVRGTALHVSSRRKGSFVYDFKHDIIQ